MSNNKLISKFEASLLGYKPTDVALALVEASREISQAQTAVSEQQRQLLEDRAHKKTMEAFRQIDTKQTELEIYDKASKDVVVEDVVIGKAGGRDIVQRKIIKSRNINHLVRNSSRENVAAIIRLLLVNLNNYFNVKDGLNHYQIEEIADQIIDECGDKLFIDELVYIFKKMKVDTKLYNHLDGSIIFQRIDIHYDKKFQEKERRHATNKSENFDIPNMPKGMLSGALEKMTEGYRKNIISINDIPKINKKKKDK